MTFLLLYMESLCLERLSQIAKFMGPTWGPSGSYRPQMGPCWPHEPCYQESLFWNGVHIPSLRCWRWWTTGLFAVVPWDFGVSCKAPWTLRVIIRVPTEVTRFCYSGIGKIFRVPKLMWVRQLGSPCLTCNTTNGLVELVLVRITQSWKII